MALLIEVVIAIAVFFGIITILSIAGVASVLGATFIAIIKVFLGVAAIIWVVRLIGRLLA